MTRAILLTGDPGVGKTTLLLRILEHISCPAGGFYTQEIRQSGQRLGFKITTLDGHESILAHVSFKSPWRVGKYGVDISVLDNLAADCLGQAIAAEGVVVIDEIGPMEILSQRFRQTVWEALRSRAVVLGTVVKRPLRFADEIKALPGVTVLEVRRETCEAIGRRALELLREAGCAGLAAAEAHQTTQ